MSENGIVRAAIAATLRAVPGIGSVHEYERYAKDDKSFRQFYGAGADGLHGWHIRRVKRVHGAGIGEVRTTWEIRGFKAISDADASELMFDDLIDLVITAYRADPTLGGTVLWPTDDDPWAPDIADSGPAVFAGVLCHCVKLILVTRHVSDDAPLPGY